jgi:catechol 2,3-dioxygenase-like lactoylglutathione lyase family enzyme
MEQALDLFTRVLGFEVLYAEANYRYLTWGPVPLRVLEEPGRPGPAGGKARISVYIDVNDVDTLYAELQPGLATLPEGDVHGPMDEPWNQRELHVRLPDGDWLAFGQPIRIAGA